MEFEYSIWVCNINTLSHALGLSTRLEFPCWQKESSELSEGINVKQKLNFNGHRIGASFCRMLPRSAPALTRCQTEPRAWPPFRTSARVGVSGEEAAALLSERAGARHSFFTCSNEAQIWGNQRSASVGFLSNNVWVQISKVQQ